MWKSEGRAVYNPKSFAELVRDASQAVYEAVTDGLNRLEVEFPPLPGQDSDGYKNASDSYVDANVQFALSFARQMSERKGKKVHILVPDQNEYRRSYNMFKSTLDLCEGVTMGYLSENRPGPFSGFGGLFGKAVDPRVTSGEAAKQADIFVAINCSTVELADLERYTEAVIGERPVVLWNTELDLLRADLGLLGFPSKDLQYRFLSFFTPVFYVRQRDYSKSVNVAPFLINYSGCLFREYPGPWQVMLRQDSGSYACVAEDKRRYNLGEFKEALMEAMGLNTEEKGSAMEFLRRGYKRSTWWEDAENEEKSHNWRS
ncbi:hypothetical protein WJX72_001521 [[Myrmecia] bisecta]|uniref:DUF1995 domain-containing protein n=1 Tax=[Myrmecia] bisecta TaxID=41462 RepID=A0AAW1Q6I4_9CHLO